MTGDDTARLIYLALLGSVILLSFFAHTRESLGKLTQQALIWGLIFVGVIAAVGLWGDIRSTVQPSVARVVGENSVELERQMDGHYYVTAQVNGAPIDFVVDTGATVVVLTRDDARKAGIDTADLAFIGRAGTANGEVRTAPVRLDRFSIGPIEDRGVSAVVNSGELGQSLLGMSYLQRFSRVEIANGKLVLTR